MKLLFEVAPQIESINRSEFIWLRNNQNWIFVIEDGKILRTIGSEPKPGLELQSTKLTESRTCTSYSWNKDGSLLALVVDRRQIYFWRIDTNNFTHFKPNSLIQRPNDVARQRTIDFVVWSRISNKLVVCYSTGQLLLCNDEENLSETFIDNSDGIMKKVDSIEASDYHDMFVCSTITNELLVMSFGGQVMFYAQLNDQKIARTALSPTFENVTLERDSDGQLLKQHGAWLAYQTSDNQLSFKEISFGDKSSFGNHVDDAIYSHDKIDSQSKMINFHWVGPTHLVVCFSQGDIFLMHLKRSSTQRRVEVSVNSLSTTNGSMDFRIGDQPVNASEVMQNGCSDNENSFAMALVCDTKLLYFDIVKTKNNQFAIEEIDSLDLSQSLGKLNLSVDRAAWSNDCSLLALQLTNHHILIFQTKLKNFLIDCRGSRVAYLSDRSEVIVLNYEHERRDYSQETSSFGSANALTIAVNLEPSVLAVGSRHLAVALNNRIQFYSLEEEMANHEAGQSDVSYSRIINECEYSAIVMEISLNSSYVAALFEDLRLKLHPIENHHSANEDLNERFFPDPQRADEISAFVLTQSHLIYCTKWPQIIVFSITDWCTLQTLDHGGLSSMPVVKLRANAQANKFICLPSTAASSCQDADGFMLYDLFRNEVVGIGANEFYSKIYLSQLVSKQQHQAAGNQIPRPERRPRFGPISNAIWDTDGRSFLLVERRQIHVLVAIDHTLEREGPVVVHVSSASKLSSHTPLYASQGIVSYQTVLGRVINSILETHDDEMKLLKLEEQICELRSSSNLNHEANDRPPETGGKSSPMTSSQIKLQALKLEYLNTIIPLYPLARSKDICDHLMEEEALNLDTNSRVLELELVVWRQLAAWSLYTMNLNFALLIYRRHKMNSEATFLRRLVSELQSGQQMDAKTHVKSKLMLLLTGE